MLHFVTTHLAPFIKHTQHTAEENVPHSPLKDARVRLEAAGSPRIAFGKGPLCLLNGNQLPKGGSSLGGKYADHRMGK